MIRVEDTMDETQHPIKIQVLDTPDYIAQVVWLEEDEALDLYNKLAPIAADIIDRRARDKA